MLWTDLVEPSELTTVARTAFLEQEQRKQTLARFLPYELRMDTVIRLNVGDNGLTDAAEYRAYDAETPIAGKQGGEQITLTLPPLGQKHRVGEYDQLRMRGVNSERVLRDEIGKEVIKRAQAIADRIELMRGQILVSGKATIGENRFFAENDFGRDEEMTVTAGVLWSDDSAKPLQDLEAWADAYIDKNGEYPQFLVASSKVIRDLSKSKEFLPPNSTRGRATLDEVNAVLQDSELPQIVRYDRRVRVNGKAVRVLDEDKLLLLPPTEANLGSTFWGTPLESYEPGYAIQPEERPGIAAGAYKDDDPIGVWVKASAIGLPVLADANLALSATVR